MSVMRRAVGKRRTVVKNELRGAVAIMHGFFKGLVFFPEIQDIFFHFGKIDFSIQFRIIFFLFSHLKNS